MEFNSMVMEGADQVGKADTSHDLSQELLSQEYLSVLSHFLNMLHLLEVQLDFFLKMELTR